MGQDVFSGRIRGSFVQPDYKRDEKDKPVDENEQQREREKDNAPGVGKDYDDECPQEEGVHRGLAHRNKCASDFS